MYYVKVILKNTLAAVKISSVKLGPNALSNGYRLASCSEKVSEYSDIADIACL